VKLAVIIRYFQKRPADFCRALSSVLRQHGRPVDTVVDIIVVDDGSPVPARTETDLLTFAPPYELFN
jgi:succinoglycan biosynthesis protein ExoW